MDKYSFATISIEVTRRCNMSCAHCMRGDAQNITMSKDTIDRLTDDVDTCISAVITGGEPLLELDTVEYLISAISAKWNIQSLQLITNGTILDDRIIKAFEDFCKVNEQRKVLFGFSKDRYHTPGVYEDALAFYEPLINDANSRLGSGESERIELRTAEREETIAYVGRAVDLIEKSRHEFKISENFIEPKVGLHRLNITGNCVMCIIGITVYGGVIAAVESHSYNYEDEYAIGYLDKSSMSEIIERHNNDNLLLCSESLYLDVATRARLSEAGQFPIADSLRVIAYAEVCRAILKIRYAAQKMYRNLAAEDIIRELPMPKSKNEFDVVLALLATASPYQSPATALGKLDGQINKWCKETWKDMSLADCNGCNTLLRALAYLADTNCTDYLIQVYADKIQKLAGQSQQYKALGIVPNNDTAFACGENHIFSNQYN